MRQIAGDQLALVASRLQTSRVASSSGKQLSIEILAWHGGVITRLDGIVPNSILHVLLFVGFAFYAASARAEPAV